MCFNFLRGWCQSHLKIIVVNAMWKKEDEGHMEGWCQDVNSDCIDNVCISEWIIFVWCIDMWLNYHDDVCTWNVKLLICITKDKMWNDDDEMQNWNNVRLTIVNYFEMQVGGFLDISKRRLGDWDRRTYLRR